MKKFIPVLLLLLVLAGCGQNELREAPLQTAIGTETVATAPVPDAEEAALQTPSAVREGFPRLCTCADFMYTYSSGAFTYREVKDEALQSPLHTCNGVNGLGVWLYDTQIYYTKDPISDIHANYAKTSSDGRILAFITIAPFDISENRDTLLIYDLATLEQVETPNPMEDFNKIGYNEETQSFDMSAFLPDVLVAGSIQVPEQYADGFAMEYWRSEAYVYMSGKYGDTDDTASGSVITAEPYANVKMTYHYQNGAYQLAMISFGDWDGY